MKQKWMMRMCDDRGIDMNAGFHCESLTCFTATLSPCSIIKYKLSEPNQFCVKYIWLSDKFLLCKTVKQRSSKSTNKDEKKKKLQTTTKQKNTALNDPCNLHSLFFCFFKTKLK